MSTHVMTGREAFSNETGKRVRAVLASESEVAHVWAAETQTHGRFRAIYFEGRTLYSYGSHYAIGRLYPAGVVLLNAESNSMTTNGHRRSAASAVSHKTRHWIPDLTAALRLLDDLDESESRTYAKRLDPAERESYLARIRERSKIRRGEFREYMIRNAAGFISPDLSTAWPQVASDGDAAALYVLRLAGLPARSWPAIKAEAERRAVRDKAERKAIERRRALADMRQLATMSDSDFRESWPSDGVGASSWQRGLGYHESQFEQFRKRLSSAHRLASAEKLQGFKRKLWQRLEAFRAYAAERPERLRAKALAALRADFATWRSGGAKPFLSYDSAERFPELAGDIAELQAASEEERQAAALAAFNAWQAGNGERPSVESFAEGTAERAAIEAAKAAELESAIAALEAWRAGNGEKPESIHFYQWERQPAELRERVGGDPWREVVLGYSKAKAAELLAAELEAERLKRASEAERAAAWIAGKLNGGGFSDSDGGALLRIAGDPAEPESAELETSHGARVPLAHAIKAFRFVKLIRQRGGHWQRNGKQIRVGHYNLDSIDPAGFNAGCHRINWPEIERVAKLAGVFDCPADDAAVIETAHA